MLHRFLARARVWVRVVVWQVAVGACHAASVCWVSISVWTFAFRVRFVGILSAVEWSMKRERERAQEGDLLVVPCVSLCVRALPPEATGYDACLSVWLSQLPSPSSSLSFLPFCLCPSLSCAFCFRVALAVLLIVIAIVLCFSRRCCFSCSLSLLF